MRKADIILEIHNKTGIAKVDILVILETYFQEVKQTVFEGENVSVRGFGTFTNQLRKAKIGRNIKANTTVEIPEHYIPKFKPAKEFMDSLKSVKLLLLYGVFFLVASCNSPKKIAERKLIVNFKELPKIHKTLEFYNYELIYFDKKSINDFREKNASKSVLYSNDLELFFKEIAPSLDKLNQILNHSVLLIAKSQRQKRKIKQSLEQDPNVVFVQENELQKLHYYPNDPYYSSLWGISKVNCSQAWDLSEGNNVVVAVIDDGTFINHQDITGNLWRGRGGEYGYDFTDNGNLNPNGNFHGTHVAGTISAIGNNNSGVIGVAPKAKIMTLKVFPNADDIRCAKAFAKAIENNANVINNSWGPTQRRESNPEVSRLINIAHSRSISVVFSAGNNNDDVKYYAPANHPRVIAVAATNEIDQRCNFSNFGNQVSVAAPGQNIKSLNASINGISELSGTSMAAPHVSGLVALLLQINPKLTPEQIKFLIENSATIISTDKPLGFGRINVYNTVRQAIITQRHSIKLNFIGVLTDQDDFGSNEICTFSIPFEISLLPDGQINTGEIITKRCDNEVWAKIFYSCSMDFNKTLEFTGNLILYDADNLQGSQTFNVRLPYGRNGNIVSGDVCDDDLEDKVNYRIEVKTFE